MKPVASLPLWSIAAPAGAWLLFAVAALSAGTGNVYTVLFAVGLIAGLLAAVFLAEVVVHRIGEPFGTLVLALAATAIEVALIVSLMIAGGGRHREQVFGLHGVSAALTTLAAIAVLTMLLPNYTTTTPGPAYNPAQLLFVALVSAVLYGTLILVQTVRHRDYFLPEAASGDEETHAAPASYCSPKRLPPSMRRARIACRPASTLRSARRWPASA